MKRKLIEYKMKFVLGAVFLVILVLLARVSYLQLVQTEEYRTLARNNYIRIAPVFAPRGEIFDRNGEKIVTNRPIYTVSINDLNLEGTTYHLYLNRTGADIVDMADTLAWILAGDEETLLYFEQISGETLQDYAKKNGVTIKQGEDSGNAGANDEQLYVLKKKFIEEKIKERARDNKNQLEQGQRLEIAVVYNPSTMATLNRYDLESYGVTVEKKADVLSTLVQMLLNKGVYQGQTAYEIESRMRKEIRDKKLYRPYEPVLVAEDIPPEMVVALREKQMELPGVVVDIQPVRDYPYGDLLTHVLGYVQNIKKEQYEAHKDEGYLMNDLYGQNGLELVYEKYLRGEHGARQVEVDASGRPVRDLGLKPAVPGNDLVLTIDLDLQLAAEKALADGVKRAQGAGFKLARAGAAVVMDVRTGAILAMASYPTYHPGIFTGGLTSAEWQELQESGALLNRAIAATYPPGSTFKMVTSAAILEKKIVDPEYKMPDPGYYRLGRGVFRDWKPGGHGSVDLRKALEVSCDTYFYQFGRMAGVDAIAHFAREFGLGQKTGINLPGEMRGTLPTPEWKYEMVKSMLIRYNKDFARVRELNRMIDETQSESRKQELRRLRDEELEKQLKKHEWDLNWQQYETINMSIGQGDNTYTPLQLVSYVAAIANGGTLYKPYLVEKVVSPHGALIKEFKPEIRHKVDIDPENLQIIREGMHRVTLPPTGTASGVFYGFKHSAAAKTGTAEVIDANGRKKGNHALFVTFAPYEKPEVAVAVVLEYGDSGSGYAGPIARQILEAYFNDSGATDIDKSKDRAGGDAAAGREEEPAGRETGVVAINWPGLEKHQDGEAGLNEPGGTSFDQMLWEKLHEMPAATRPVTGPSVPAPLPRAGRQAQQQPAPAPQQHQPAPAPQQPQQAPAQQQQPASEPRPQPAPVPQPPPVNAPQAGQPASPQQQPAPGAHLPAQPEGGSNG
ncbi:penicillin-binding protein 2 [Desulfallas sp. Bu1-1]|uniref:penicillin-binding protein 2 n=1 Tax=Desulfallas sp. Bu1-1 TaxID=2787620 RepID=UPI00189E8D35|nr:penicillin-binding protein 2 [Desulfallas sp. Bu1-1]MBF7083715.1 penicillin-binding protein 2 [Desulfallas sp. Bu1-1]